MAIDPQNQKNIDETTVYIQDTLISVSAKIGEVLKDAVNEAFDGAEATVLKSMGNDLTRTFKSAARFSDKIAENNYKLNKGLIGTKEIQAQIVEIELKKDALDRKFEALSQLEVEYSEQDKLNAEEALKIQLESLKASEAEAKIIEKNLGSTGAILDRLSKSKFLGPILNAKEGLVAMRAAAAKGETGFKLLGKGIKAAFAGIEKASIVLFIANQVLKLVKFFKDLAFGVSEQATNLARALGTAKDSGFALRQQFEVIAKESEGTLYNIRNFVKSVQELSTTFGFVRDYSEDILKTQSLLTTRLQVSSEEASNLNMLFKATGQNTEEAFESMNKLGIAMQEADGIGVTMNTVISDIAAGGAEAASYFGYSTNALAEAVINARKLGLNITQAKTVAKGLLDFENSIQSQLELSVLTQKQFNFGNAMAKAAIGDVAGATQDVIRQMNQLTAEQRKSPIILEAMSKATGLSTEELAKQYALQYDINAQKEEYGRILEKEGLSAARTFLVNRGIAQAEVAEIENRISASEQFNEALDQAKDAFATLVNGGLLDRMILGITGLVEYLENSWFFGPSTAAKTQSKRSMLSRNADEDTKKEIDAMRKEEAELVAKQQQQMADYRKAIEGKGYQSVRDHGTNESDLRRLHEKQLEKLQEKQLEMLDAIEKRIAEDKVIQVDRDRLAGITTKGKIGKRSNAI